MENPAPNPPIFEQMNLTFRDLTIKDIPAIIEISKGIWEGDDYIPHVIEFWLEAQDSKVIGVFDSGDPDKLLAFSRLRWYTPAYTWAEGGRVDPAYQKSGIGRKMAEYLVELSRTSGAKKIQYDTYSQNEGSLKIGVKLGYTKKQEMDIFRIKHADIPYPAFSQLPYPKARFKQLSIENAYANLIELPNGPGEELSMGWRYTPLLMEVLKKEPFRCYGNPRAAVNEVFPGDDMTSEGPLPSEIWFTLYGVPSEAISILTQRLEFYRDKPEIEEFFAFCHPKIAPLLPPLGFNYLDGVPGKVVLLEHLLD